MAWVDLGTAFGYGAKLTSTQMQNLRDNIAAAFAKDSGAPQLASRYITEPMMSENCVTNWQLAEPCVYTIHLTSDSVTEVKIVNDAVTTSKLKTSVSNVSTNNHPTGQHLTFTGGSYCHYPYINGNTTFEAVINKLGSTGGADLTKIYLKPSVEVTVYANTRYHTSSGEVFWIFILRDKKTRKIIAQSCAPDHVCFGNGGKPLLVQHPFADVLSDTNGFYLFENDKKREVEIVVLNPNKEEVRHCHDKMVSLDPMEADRNFAQIFDEQMDYTTSDLKGATWVDKPVTVGLKNDLDWSHGETEPILAVISRPKNIILGRTKLKN